MCSALPCHPVRSAETSQTSVYSGCCWSQIHDRIEEGSSISAVKKIVNMKELIDINNDSGTVKDEKGHNNTEKDEEKVDLFLHLPFQSKSLNFYISEIRNNSDIEAEDGEERHDGRKRDVEVGLIHLDVTFRCPELSWGVVRYAILPNQDCIEESWDVGDDADE